MSRRLLRPCSRHVYIVSFAVTESSDCGYHKVCSGDGFCSMYVVEKEKSTELFFNAILSINTPPVSETYWRTEAAQAD